MAKDDFKFKLDKQDIRVIRDRILEHSLKFFLNTYTKQGKADNGFTRWKDRKKKTGKKLLYKTGNMKSSFKTVNTSSNKGSIVNTADYAIYHNEGTDNMPKREFLYESKELDNQVEDLIVSEIDKLFKK